MNILTELHPDHLAHFTPSARPTLAYHGTDAAEAERVLLAYAPSSRTSAADGTYAVWHLTARRR